MPRTPARRPAPRLAPPAPSAPAEAPPQRSPGPMVQAAAIVVAAPDAIAGPPVQRAAGPAAAGAVAIPSGGGRPLAPATRQRMEGLFGADLGGVRTYSGGHVPALGALAFTRGDDVHFAPGQMNDRTLKHELTHVMQQRSGRVKATGDVRGVPLNDDPSLEREADAMSRREKP